MREFAMGWRPTISDLLRIDCVGAIVSAGLLTLVVGGFPDVFGMPSSVSVGLGAAAALYAVASVIGLLRGAHAHRGHLWFVACANTLHCAATAVLVAAHREQVKPLGYAYFAGEVVIVLALVAVEVRALRSHVK